MINENEKIHILQRVGLRETWWIRIVSCQSDDWKTPYFQKIQNLIYYYTEIHK